MVRYFPLIVFIVFIGTATLLLQRQLFTIDLAMESSVVSKPAPLPTGINQDFLNQINKCFIPSAAVYGYSLRITSGFRSITEQDQLFDQGRTEDGHIVTWAEPGKSIHNYGFAVDIADREHGYNIDWKKLGKIGALCDLIQVDDSHFEYRGGLTTAQFEAGLLPSPPTLPCTLMDEKAKLNQPLTLMDLKNCNLNL